MSEWEWLRSTRKLQEESFGIDFKEMARDGSMRADYALLNAYALIDEISEAMDEIAWKPWAKDRGAVNRDAMLGELVDAAHFMANLLTMLGVTDEEWARRYEEKQQRNARRQQTEGGYDARQDKCPSCKRELDKDGSIRIIKRVSSGIHNDSSYIECASCYLILGMLIDGEPEWDESVIVKNSVVPKISDTIHK